MTGEKLLLALQAVDPALAEDARSPARRRMPRRLTAALIAAALVLALGAGAAAYYSDFFLDFFAERRGGELTEEQQTVVGALTAAVGQSQSVDGWTVTVDEAVAAKNNVYIKLTVTAPEGTALDGAQYRFRQIELSGGPEDVAMAGTSQGVKPDDDSHDGRVTILWTHNVSTQAGSQASFADGAARTLTLTDFCLSADDGTYTALAEGTWRFELTLTEQAADQADEAELVDGPVPCTAVSERWNSAGEIKRTEAPVTLTSFRLTALGATCEYEWTEQEALEFPEVSVTLLDGAQVRANMRSGAIGICSFELDVPIDLAQVDHVTIQGVELPMP